MRPLLLLLLLAAPLAAQVVPPAPTLTPLPIQAPAVANVNVEFDAPQCGQAPPSGCQGLSDCGCWVQLWKAPCSSATACPAPVKASPYVMDTTIGVVSWADNGRGGQHIVLNDTDAALAAGTTWQYFATTNFGQAVTPPAYSAASNGSGAVSIPKAAVPAAFKIQLDYDNSQCVTGSNCTADVFRATCSGSTTANCPSFSSSPSAFTLLTLTTTQTVSATNTHFVSLDTGASPNTLANATPYAYAVRNTFTAYPSNPGNATQISFVTPTGSHSAVINWSNPNCRTSSPCTIQVYRATCASSTSCPAYPGSAWKALNMSIGLVPTVGTQGTSWQYTDSDAALVGSTTYAWLATNAYSGGTTASPASSAWSGTTAVGRSGEKHEKTLHVAIPGPRQ